MKTKHLFWGVLFISIGVFILIDKFYYLTFTWDGVWKLWPIVLILWGFAFIFTHPIAKKIIAALCGFFLAFALFGSVKATTYFFDRGFDFEFSDKYDGDTTSFAKTEYKAAFDKKFQKSDFYFKAGAGSFLVKDTSQDLFHANAFGLNANYKLETKDNGDNANVDFQMKNTTFHFGEKKMRNRVEMNFNPDPLWNMKFEVGAASMRFDFSPYKINDLNIHTGAASLNVKLGDKSDETHMNIESGAASVDVQVPENTGCEIKTNMSLSSHDFAGFNKVEDHLYRTDNFNNASKKIYLTFSSGISSIKVSRYSGSTSW